MNRKDTLSQFNSRKVNDIIFANKLKLIFFVKSSQKKKRKKLEMARK